VKVLAGVLGFLVLIHLGDLAKASDALWKWFLTVL
jgi:hypothetical protein